MRNCFLVLAILRSAIARQSVLSNKVLPVDTAGNQLLTGEADVLAHNGMFYFYINNWGGCIGVDCCSSSGGCASCCFSPPSAAYPDACVYTNNHSVVVYATRDFGSWAYLGEALPLSSRIEGIEFRPHVVFNNSTGQFVMWYEDRHTNQQGYAIAVSTTPEGPFSTIANSVVMTLSARTGDYDVFIDDDSQAYHVRTGFVVERLNASYTGGTNETATFSTPKPAEGPVMFKRNNTYFVLAGTGCCACRGGSSVYVFTADSPLGLYTYRGDIGSNRGPFNASSPDNYVTKSQASAVFRVPVPSSSPSLLLDQSVLNFDEITGLPQQLQWQDSATVIVP